jgi:acetyltransferase-like isoleucine patch superfamily enzyme
MRIGKGSSLSRLVAYQPEAIQIGKSCLLEPDLFFKYVGPPAERPAIVVGDRVFIGRGTEFNIVKGLEIGDDAMIASGCLLVDHDHGFASRDLPISRQPHVAERIVIGAGAWLGAGVTILKGVSIGEGAIIAAGGVVTQSVGPYEIWGGVPAKKIGDRP